MKFKKKENWTEIERENEQIKQGIQKNPVLKLVRGSDTCWDRKWEQRPENDINKYDPVTNINEYHPVTNGNEYRPITKSMNIAPFPQKDKLTRVKIGLFWVLT